MRITESDISNLTNLIRAADKAVMSIYYTQSTEVEWKSDNTPLTQADKASHEIIVNGLKELFPSIPVVSEEGDFEVNKSLVKSALYWLVDPLDGTREFINRTDEFCVGVALIENNKPTFGIVSIPTTSTLYYGGKAMGSYKVSPNGKQAIFSRVLSPHVVAVSRSNASQETLDFIDQHFPNSTQIALGSMLKQVKLAEGEIDVYPLINRGISLWDVAPGHAIIEGAGGRITRPDGSPLDYSRPDLELGDFVAQA